MLTVVHKGYREEDRGNDHSTTREKRKGFGVRTDIRREGEKKVRSQKSKTKEEKQRHSAHRDFREVDTFGGGRSSVPPQ